MTTRQWTQLLKEEKNVKRCIVVQYNTAIENTAVRKQPIPFPNLKCISSICQKCKGSCYTENHSLRQEQVIKKFGQLPDKCAEFIRDGQSISKCPFKNHK